MYDSKFIIQIVLQSCHNKPFLSCNHGQYPLTIGKSVKGEKKSFFCGTCCGTFPRDSGGGGDSDRDGDEKNNNQLKAAAEAATTTTAAEAAAAEATVAAATVLALVAATRTVVTTAMAMATVTAVMRTATAPHTRGLPAKIGYPMMKREVMN